MKAGVLFDVDGTLVDTTYLHAVSWWEAREVASDRPHGWAGVMWGWCAEVAVF